jgi:hypothetical protein
VEFDSEIKNAVIVPPKSAELEAKRQRVIVTVPPYWQITPEDKEFPIKMQSEIALLATAKSIPVAWPHPATCKNTTAKEASGVIVTPRLSWLPSFQILTTAPVLA